MRARSNVNNEQSDHIDETNDSFQSGGRPISRILQEIVSHVTEITRSEVRLAVTEVRQDVREVAKAGVFYVIGTVFGLFALGFILLGVVYSLQSTMPAWLSAGIVGVGAGIVAATFLLVGRMKMNRTSLKPDKTIRSLEENVTWMNKRTE